MLDNVINISDLIIAPLYLAIIFIVLLFIKNHQQQEKAYYSFFLKGFFLKVLGAFAFALIYIYYYGGGDTMYYFYGGNTLLEYLFNKPNEYFRLLWSSSDFSPDLYHIRYEITYAKSNEEWFMVKIMSVLNFFAFQRYLVSTLFTATLSFIGGWRMFQAFLFFFPKQKKLIFYAVFMSPSLVFWGSGVMKDTVTLAFLGIFMYHGIKLLFRYHFSLYSILLMALSVYVIITLKAYIIVSFLPLFLIAWFLNNRERITNPVIRYTLTPAIILTPVVASLFSVSILANMTQKYKLDDMEWRVKGFHSWHSSGGAGGSSYDLHVTDYSPTGILSKIPAALEVTYFRPYIYEARSLNMLITSVEGMIFLFLFLFILWKYRLKLFLHMFNHSLLFLSFSYAILFGFAVGFTSYNFGALARYKIPALPFALFFLLFFAFNKKENIQRQIKISMKIR